MSASNGQFMSFLDSKQEDLLTAALNSNHQQNGNMMDSQFSNNIAQFNQFGSLDGMDPSLFMNNNNLAMGSFGANTGSIGGSIDNTPFLDNLNYDESFDYDFNDANGQMIGALPGDEDDVSEEQHHDIHDKRKSPDDEKADNENGGKRREGEAKEAKKPGRKPLTSEPTNKRKAQNRAAQRAFRERKEKHVKDMETKIEELEKASESANHENGLLRAQVERLQIELREYRKRLSMNSGLLGRTPALGGNMFLPSNGASNASNNFQFDFPRFGSLPGGVFGSKENINGKAATSNAGAGVLARSGSNGRSISPRSQQRASMSSSTSPAANNGSISSNVGTPNNNGGSMTTSFTPAGDMNGFNTNGGLDYTNWVTTTTSAEPESTTNGSNSRIFQFNSGSNSTASPESSSSLSQYNGGANSSCGTSPEPTHNSPQTKNLDGNHVECQTIQKSDGEISFCERLNMACGNIRNPIPRTKSQSDGTSGANNAKTTTTNDNFNGFGDLASQNGGGFDPQLFDTYREPQSAIVGDGDFTGGFFNDALPTMDFASPFDWANLTAPTGLTPAIQKQNPLEVADAISGGLDAVVEEEEVVPADEPGALLSCHKIWDKLQDRPDFKDGSLDIDGLCSELRAKARCSESGVVIDQKDVDSALKRVSPAQQNAVAGQSAAK